MESSRNPTGLPESSRNRWGSDKYWVAHSSICTGWWRNRANSFLSIIVMSDVVAICIEIGINNYGPILTGLAGVNPIATTGFG